ncbi:MAG: DUF309 domain-containing protein [Thermoplasmata archaeon]
MPRFLLMINEPGVNKGLVERLVDARWVIMRKKSSGVEVDISTEHEDMINRINAIYRVQYVINLDEHSNIVPDWTVDDILEYVSSMFRVERYWETHEFLENYWKLFSGGTKRFIHGLILVSVSMVKHQMGQEDEAHRIYSRAMDMLSGSHSKYLKYLHFPDQFQYPVFINLSKAD